LLFVIKNGEGQILKHGLNLILIETRQDLADTGVRERSWLVINLLELVGRRLVHDQLPGIDRPALLNLTVATCKNLLANSPDTKTGE
jgi:hypothetical protein